MKQLRLLFPTVLTLLGSGVSLLGACSSDTSVQQLNVPVDQDASQDGSSTTDSSTDRDTGAEDAASDDASTKDASIEDASSEDADTGTDDAGVDPGTSIESYRNAVADTLCTSVSRCCFGPTPIPDGGVVDGGAYDPTVCLNVGRDLGFNLTNSGIKWASSERIELDQAKATECLKKIKALSCSLTGAELRAARTACFSAIKGKQQLADTCTVSMECAQGYCKPSDPAANATAANGGVCTSLVVKGGDCGGAFHSGDNDTDQQYAEEVCSTRNSGDTKLHCASYDYGNGDYVDRDNGSWTCADSNVPIGGGCSFTSWCATGICNEQTYTCQDPVELLPQWCPTLIHTK